MASATTEEEGVAEWVRRSIADPASVPAAIDQAIRQQLSALDPKYVQLIDDSRSAFEAYAARPAVANWRSYRTDQPKPTGAMQLLRDAWHGFLYHCVSELHVPDTVRKRMFEQIKGVSLALARQS
jgi:hypothetical protein